MTQHRLFNLLIMEHESVVMSDDLGEEYLVDYEEEGDTFTSEKQFENGKGISSKYVASSIFFANSLFHLCVCPCVLLYAYLFWRVSWSERISVRL